MPKIRLRTSGERQTAARSTAKLGRRRRVVIPKSICERTGLREGDPIEIRAGKKQIVIKARKARVRNPAPEYETLTPAEEKSVMEGIKQLRRGDYVTWDQLKDELGL